MSNTNKLTRSDIQERYTALHASLVVMHQSSRAENRFLRSLNRSRQRSANAPRQSTITDGRQTASKTVELPQPRSARRVVRPEIRAVPKRQQTPLNTVLSNAAATPSPDRVLRHSEVHELAPLQSSRAQELRAEIERCVTMAMRAADGSRCGDEFRLILPPSLVPDTTLVLSRRQDGWTLTAITSDLACRDVLTGGAAKLRQRFISKNLGDLLVTVTFDSAINEPSYHRSGPTSQSCF